MHETREGIVRRMVQEVWNRGNLQVIDEVFTDDCVGHNPTDPTRGREAVKEVVRKYRSAFPDARIDIDETFSAGDRVVARWRYSGTQLGQLDALAPTGRRVEGTGITIYRFSGDRIEEEFENWDALGLMQQLGVVTLPGKAARAGA